LPEVAGDSAQFFDPDDSASLRKVLEDMVNLGGVGGTELLDRAEVRARRFSWEATALATRRAYDGVRVPEDSVD
jgi:glycosyltransferase involved in cell wall biosynthesis